MSKALIKLLQEVSLEDVRKAAEVQAAAERTFGEILFEAVSAGMEATADSVKSIVEMGQSRTPDDIDAVPYESIDNAQIRRQIQHFERIIERLKADFAGREEFGELNYILDFKKAKVVWSLFDENENFIEKQQKDDFKGRLVVLDPTCRQLQTMKREISYNPDYEAVFFRPEELSDFVAAALIINALSLLYLQMGHDFYEQPMKTQDMQRATAVEFSLKIVNEMTRDKLFKNVATALGDWNLNSPASLRGLFVSFGFSPQHMRKFVQYMVTLSDRTFGKKCNSKTDRFARKNLIYQSIAYIVTKNQNYSREDFLITLGQLLDKTQLL